MSVDDELISALRQAMAAAADPQRAAGAQTYLKSVMPMYGLRVPDVRRLARDLITAHPPSSRAGWQDTVRALYDDAGHREERYAALVLAGHRLARPWQDPETLALYRHLVVAGAWWDLVDWVATGLVAPILRAYPAPVGPTMRAWAVDDDLWIRRTAVLSQVGARAEVDVDLLADCLGPNLERDEFWLRKACGWALRDIAPWRPEWVRAYLAANGHRMSGLTRREAARRLPADT